MMQKLNVSGNNPTEEELEELIEVENIIEDNDNDGYFDVNQGFRSRWFWLCRFPGVCRVNDQKGSREGNSGGS